MHTFLALCEFIAFYFSEMREEKGGDSGRDSQIIMSVLWPTARGGLVAEMQLCPGLGCRYCHSVASEGVS
jgi:hypothetical protein